MTIYQHRFRGRAPIVRWRLTENGETIAKGWALTKTAAWQASIDAIPPIKRPEIDEILAPYKRPVTP
jgi:hypothetical protein